MLSHRHLRTRVGIALATTLYFLVLLGLLVIGTLSAARVAGASGEMLIDDAELTAAVDHTLTDAVADWPSRTRAAQPLGSTFRELAPLNARVNGAVSITRISSRLYWVAADVRRLTGVARRRASVVVRLVDDGPALSAGIVARGDVLLGGGARVEGARGSPQDCAAGDSAAVAIEVGSGSSVADEEGDTLPTWRATDRAADASTYAQLGARRWEQLASDIELPADAALSLAPSPSGDCGATRAPDDWGEPLLSDGPCASWWPIVHARGDLTLTGGRGQGILLVEGRLRVTGALRFRGLIVSRGNVEISADAVEISGAVLSDAPHDFGGAFGSSVVIRGRALIHASRCDVARAFAAHSNVRRVRERAWIELW